MPARRWKSIFERMSGAKGKHLLFECK